VARASFDRLFDMSDRTVIVTGGTRGIGLALAEGFVRPRGRKSRGGQPQTRRLDKAAAHLRDLGGHAIGVPTHLGEVETSARSYRRRSTSSAAWTSS
jgi:NAD(P)-dependent dehydrogenase (short-subunit alcohol dehydrogenase family)